VAITSLAGVDRGVGRSSVMYGARRARAPVARRDNHSEWPRSAATSSRNAGQRFGISPVEVTGGTPGRLGGGTPPMRGGFLPRDRRMALDHRDAGRGSRASWLVGQ